MDAPESRPITSVAERHIRTSGGLEDRLREQGGERADENVGMTDPSLWENSARWWQQEFTNGSDPEYEEQILPLVERHLEGCGRVLDVGCGEGQVARRVAALGGHVVGIDPTAAQIDEARRRGGGVAYVRAAAEGLPIASASVDAVVMCLVIEHLDPVEPAIREMARVLVPGGRCLLLVNHPLLQAPGSGWIDDHILEEQYWRVGAYLREDVTVEELAPGVNLPFIHRPLSRYVHLMGASGLLIEDMDEPPPPPGFLAEAWEYEAAATIPRLMLILARRVG
jgi:SAM-dependent methyltransferase